MIRKITLFIIITALTSCSVFQSKYIEIEREDGRCWDEYYFDLIEDEQVGDTDYPYSQLIIELMSNNSSDSNIDTSDYSYVGIKLSNTLKNSNQFVDYELKNYYLDNRLSLCIVPGEYKLEIYNLEHKIDSSIKLQNINVSRNQIRKIKIGISKQTPCESYVVKEKILRKEFERKKR